MEKVTESLSKEHRTVLGQLEQFEAAIQTSNEEGIRATLRFFDEKIVLHRRKEEEVLFPIVGRYIGQEHGPIACMLDEHRIEKQHIEEIREALKSWPEPQSKQAIRRAGFGILELLRAHIMKEDSVLFPLSEEVMSEEDKAGVRQGFEQIGYCY